MANIKKRSMSITTGGWQVYQGAGLLVAAVFDHSASSSGNVITMYDGTSATDPQVYTRSSDTDAGTTVPITLYTDGDLPAGTSTANVKSGIPFSRGLYLTKTGDTTHTDVYTLLIQPLICKTINVSTAGSSGSAVGVANIFDGPGILHAIRVKMDINAPSTTDFLIKDSAVTAVAAGTGSGNTILTKTNYGAAGGTWAVRPTVALTGSDEAGNAVSTAATGAYASMGLPFVTGLNVSIQQCDALTRAMELEALIEA